MKTSSWNSCVTEEMEEFLKAMSVIATHWKLKELNERLEAYDVSLNRSLLEAFGYLKKSDLNIKNLNIYEGENSNKCITEFVEAYNTFLNLPLAQAINYSKNPDNIRNMEAYQEIKNSNKYIIEFFVGEIDEKGNRGKGKDGLIKITSVPSF